MDNYEEWAELVIARLRQYSPTLIFSTGGWEGNNLGLIAEVINRTPIGEFYVKMEQGYFNAIKRRDLLKFLDEK